LPRDVFDFYGLPTPEGKTIKIASEQFTATTDLDHVDQAIDGQEAQLTFHDCIQDR
jgi:hypothetical protein